MGFINASLHYTVLLAYCGYSHPVLFDLLVRRDIKATSHLCEATAQRPSMIPSLSVWYPAIPSNTSSSSLTTYADILHYRKPHSKFRNCGYAPQIYSSMAGVYLPSSTIFFLLYRTRYSVVTFLSIFSRSEHDGWMARCETEVMSLEWHLEQWEARDSHLTHHTMDSERIDSVNENIWLNPWLRLTKKRNERLLEAKFLAKKVHINNLMSY